jgi:cytochrome c
MHKSIRFVLTITSVALLAGPAAAQDAAAGARVFTRCAVCHATVPGKNGMGPSLAGVVGRKAGSIPGFNYSPAMKTAGFVWTKEQIQAFITNPQALVKGTRMMIPPVTIPKDRADVAAYLATLKK